jgi:trans-AT polyketide synthase/acyltransferase/oxidoreductase domain-containing protein
VRLIARQAEALLRKCPLAFMAAVLGKAEQLEALRSSWVHVACRNSAEHWVVTGLHAELASTKAYAESLGLIFSPLPVRYGFHSPLVEAIEREQRLLAAATPISAPFMEVVSCSYGRSRGSPDADYFWDVVRLPIDLRLAAAYVSERHGDVLYVDVGPSGTLATLLKPLLRALGGSETLPVLSPMNSDVAGILYLQRRLASTHPQASQDGARRAE